MASNSLTIGDLLYRLGFENDEQFVSAMQSVLKRGEDEAGKAGGNAGKSFTDQFKSVFTGAALGSFLGNVFGQMFTRASQAVQQFAKQSVQDFATYEQGLIQLRLAGETNLEAHEARIKSLAEQTRIFSRVDISLALGDLVKAGYDAETAFRLVEQAAFGAGSEVDAATGKFGDLSSTAVQLGNILRAMNLDADQSGRVMDVMARAAQDSNLDVSDLVDILSRVGPTAKLANLEVEDLAAMAAVLSNNGMDASLIATGLRSVLQSLINPTGDLRDELDELGISLVTRDGEIRDVNDVLDGLHELTLRGGEGLQTLTSATGSYGSTAASSMGTASEAIKQMTESLRDSEGAAEELFDMVTDSGAGSMAEWQAKMESARVELGEKLMPVMVDFYTIVMPRVVSAVEWAVDLWNQWDFLITGTTAEIRAQNEAMQEQKEQIDERMGSGWYDSLQRELDLQQERAEIEKRLDEGGFIYNMNRRSRDQERLQAISDLIAGERDLRDAIVERRQMEVGGAGGGGGGGGGRTGGLPPPLVVSNFPLIGDDPPPTNTGGSGGRTGGSASAASQRGPYGSLLWWEQELRLATEERARAQTQAERAAAEERRQIAQGMINDIQAEWAAVDPLAPVKLWTGRLTEEVSAGLKPATDVYDTFASRLEELNTQKTQLLEEGGYGTTAWDELLGKIRALESALRELDGMLPDDPRAPDRESGKVEQTGVRAAAAEAQIAAEKELQDLLTRRAQAQADLDARQAAAVSQANQDRQNIADQRREDENAAALRSKQNEDAMRQLQDLQLAHEQEGAAALIAASEAAAAKEAQLELMREQQRLQGQLQASTFEEQTRQYRETLDTALGATVRLTQAQQAFGQAADQDVLTALQGQVAAIQELLPNVEQGSDLYYQLAASMRSAESQIRQLTDAAYREALEAETARVQAIIDAEGELTEAKRQTLIERLQMELAALDASVDANQAAIDAIRVAIAQLGQGGIISIEGLTEMQQQLAGVAMSFPQALVQGIRNGDIGAAMQDALGNATDFFLDQMLQAILGPITQEMAKAMTMQTAGGGAGAAAGMGPLGWILGAGMLLASLIAGDTKRRQQQTQQQEQSVQRQVSSAPAITYNLAANVQVESHASFSDPAFYNRWRAETETLVVDLLKRVRKDS